MANGSSQQVQIPGPTFSHLFSSLRSLVAVDASPFDSAQGHLLRSLYDNEFQRFVRNRVVETARVRLGRFDLSAGDAEKDGLGDCFCLTNPRLRDHPIVLTSPGFGLSIPCYRSSKTDETGEERVTGYPRESIVGRNCRFLQGPGTSPQGVQRIRDCLNAGETCTELLLKCVLLAVCFTEWLPTRSVQLPSRRNAVLVLVEHHPPPRHFGVPHLSVPSSRRDHRTLTRRRRLHRWPSRELSSARPGYATLIQPFQNVTSLLSGASNVLSFLIADADDRPSQSLAADRQAVAGGEFGNTRYALSPSFKRFCDPTSLDASDAASVSQANGYGSGGGGKRTANKTAAGSVYADGEVSRDGVDGGLGFSMGSKSPSAKRKKRGIFGTGVGVGVGVGGGGSGGGAKKRREEEDEAMFEDMQRAFGGQKLVGAEATFDQSLRIEDQMKVFEATYSKLLIFRKEKREGQSSSLFPSDTGADGSEKSSLRRGRCSRSSSCR